MERLRIKSFLLYAALSSAVFFLLAFLTFPKFLFLDRKLSEGGLYLIAKDVDEGYLSLRLKEVELYDQNSRLVRFDSFNLSAGMLRLNFSGTCQGGVLRGEWSPWAVRLTARDFTCLSLAESLTADITFRGGIYGRIHIKGLKLRDTGLDQLSLEMKGRVFTAKAEFMGIQLVGDGQVVFNQSNPLGSKLNGQVSGGGIRLTLSGTLEKLQLTR